ncbi:hypothetical protein HKX48_001524 [Thoreauomyces humboldtii]|nr:hypothetical protein HKX48_001524 [Thoreauomyces humboldtii]
MSAAAEVEQAMAPPFLPALSRRRKRPPADGDSNGAASPDGKSALLMDPNKLRHTSSAVDYERTKQLIALLSGTTYEFVALSEASKAHAKKQKESKEPKDRKGRPLPPPGKGTKAGKAKLTAAAAAAAAAKRRGNKMQERRLALRPAPVVATKPQPAKPAVVPGKAAKAGEASTKATRGAGKLGKEKPGKPQAAEGAGQGTLKMPSLPGPGGGPPIVRVKKTKKKSKKNSLETIGGPNFNFDSDDASSTLSMSIAGDEHEDQDEEPTPSVFVLPPSIRGSVADRRRSDNMTTPSSRRNSSTVAFPSIRDPNTSTSPPTRRSSTTDHTPSRRSSLIPLSPTDSRRPSTGTPPLPTFSMPSQTWGLRLRARRALLPRRPSVHPSDPQPVYRTYRDGLMRPNIQFPPFRLAPLQQILYGPYHLRLQEYLTAVENAGELGHVELTSDHLIAELMEVSNAGVAADA